MLERLFLYTQLPVTEEFARCVVAHFRSQNDAIPEGTRVRVFMWGNADGFSYCLIYPNANEEQLIAEHIEVTRRRILAHARPLGSA